jgi:hypothetical protein
MNLPQKRKVVSLRLQLIGHRCNWTNNMTVTPQLQVQQHMGPGDGPFTQSDSVADPLLAERLPAIANPKHR